MFTSNLSETCCFTSSADEQSKLPGEYEYADRDKRDSGDALDPYKRNVFSQHTSDNDTDCRYAS